MTNLNVYERFLLYTGLDEDETSSWQCYCDDAIEEINSKLKIGVDTTLHEGRLINVMALTAYYNYCLINDCDMLQSFKAGDITIGASGGDSLKKLKEQIMNCLKGLKDLVEDETFAFIIAR